MAREKSEKKRGRKSREERKSAADAAADRLRRRILEGELPAGSMLPGERELSEQLGVSRLTLRSALASLQAQGLIEKVHGAGNRVLDYRETGGVELVAHLARLAVEGGTMPLRLLGEGHWEVEVPHGEGLTGRGVGGKVPAVPAHDRVEGRAQAGRLAEDLPVLAVPPGRELHDPTFLPARPAPGVLKVHRAHRPFPHAQVGAVVPLLAAS